MTPAAVPCLPRGVRLHHDRLRGCEVLLAPERALMLDAIGAAILSRVDGSRTLGDIVAGLAGDYDAPPEEVEGDVVEFLGRLAEQRLLDIADE